MSELEPHLVADDAVWLVTGDVEAGNALLKQLGLTGTALDLSKTPDQEIYRNFVADLLFFGVADSLQVEMLDGWAPRARAVMVDCRTGESAKIFYLANERKMDVYGWSGQGGLSRAC